MKKKLLKVLCVALCALIVLCSCTKSKESGGILKLKDGDVRVENVLKIGDHNISYDLYRYWFLTYKANMEAQAPKIDWTKESNIKDLKKTVLEQLEMDCAVLDLAKKYGYSLSEEDKEEIREIMKETFDGAGSAQDYEALLSENFLTNDIYKEILSANVIYSSMLKNLAGTDKEKNKVTFTSEDALKAVNEDFYRLVDIYYVVETTDEEGNELSEDKINANKAAAEKKIKEAYNKIKAGKDFLSLMKEIKSEEEYEKSLMGYYEPKELEGTFGFDISALKVGETSEPVYVNNSYIILHRLENDVEYLKKTGVSHDGYNLVSIEEYYSEKLVGEMLEAIAEDYKVTELEHYDDITPQTLV